MKAIFLTAATMTGKSLLLQMLRRDFQTLPITVFEMDLLEYWNSSAKPERFVAVDEYKALVGSDTMSKKMKLNLALSSDREALIKCKIIELFSEKRSFVSNVVLDKKERLNKAFFEMLEAIDDVETYHVLLHASFPRYCANVLKRCDRKPYRKTWKVRKNLWRNRGSFDLFYSNSISSGLGAIRCEMRSLLA